MPRAGGPIVVVALLAALAVTASTAPVAAQEATPGAGAAAFPIVPDPAACTVVPRSADELLALWYGPDGSPVVAAATPTAAATSVAVPVGPPADEATAAAAAAVVSEVFACLNAGDYLRAYVLFTDDLVRRFGPEPGTPREQTEAFLAGLVEMEEATPEGEDRGGAAAEGQIVAVTDVMELADGRVGAFVVKRSGGGLGTAYVAFEREGDRLLADELIEFALDEDEEGEGA